MHIYLVLRLGKKASSESKTQHQFRLDLYSMKVLGSDFFLHVAAAVQVHKYHMLLLLHESAFLFCVWIAGK